MHAAAGKTIRIGQILAERYSVQRLLGEGSVGAVYAAQDLRAGHWVAIKVLKTSALGDRLALERFKREIVATMRIECEYIVRTLGVDYLGDGTPFMVMEYFEARDLSKVIADGGPIPFDKAIGFALQLCVALAHAHRIGIVHRDIKPANLLLVRQSHGREALKVLDFGISKFAPSALLTVPHKLTGNAVRLGSPMYMSPEQRTFGREVDERADIWALGITLFEMLTGVTPFDSSPQSLCGEWEAPSSAPSVSRYRSGIPHGLDAVIARCLQRMPQSRYQDVAQVANALAPYAIPTMARLSSETVHVLGTHRSSLPPQSTAFRPIGAAGRDGLGPGTTLGPTIASGSATLRTQSQSSGNRRRSAAALASLGVVLAALSIGLGLQVHQPPPKVTARYYAATPVPAAWARNVALRASSLSILAPDVLATAPSIAPGAAPSASSRSPDANAPTGQDSAASEPVVTPTTAAPPTVVPVRSHPDLGY